MNNNIGCQPLSFQSQQAAAQVQQNDPFVPLTVQDVTKPQAAAQITGQPAQGDQVSITTAQPEKKKGKAGKIILATLATAATLCGAAYFVKKGKVDSKAWVETATDKKIMQKVCEFLAKPGEAIAKFLKGLSKGKGTGGEQPK